VARTELVGCLNLLEFRATSRIHGSHGCSRCGELASDSRFVSDPQRVKRYSVLGEALARHSLTRARWERMVRLTKADVLFAPVYQVDEALNDP
jgi:crotonobetainyl-CoA:carnitine CoA-transferase CaiB-like acyl-CoA transferase